jgi:hypothetical protein
LFLFTKMSSEKLQDKKEVIWSRKSKVT